MVKKKEIDVRDRLDKRLTSKEKKLLTQVLRENTLEFKKRAKHLHGESKKYLLTAVVAAFSFLMALSWRELFIEYIKLIEALSPVQGKLMEVGLVTFIAVIGILIANKFLGESEED